MPRVRAPSLIAVVLAVALLALTGGALSAQQNNAPGGAAPKPVHGISMYGDLKYPAGFRHFDYVDPSALKGGTVKLASSIGTFDTLNPFVLRGVAPGASAEPFESLMTSSADEPTSMYGLIAESAEMPDDRSWIIFNLRPEARFHDGQPITADDVVFSLNILKTKGAPAYRVYFASVSNAEALDPRRVKFTFSEAGNRELPLIVAGMPILAKHYWEGRDFEKTTLEPPLGSGPYRIEAVDPGRSVTLVRVPDYWGAKLPVNIGRFNFDRIRTDFYRDSTVALEAFKAGQSDYRWENSSKAWATAYDIPAVRQGLVKRERIPSARPQGMQAFLFNTRRPMFADDRVRQALNYAFDFEWTNRTLFYDTYKRTRSYFENTELAASGIPEGKELTELDKYRDRLPPELFTDPFTVPETDGTGNVRPNLLKALDLLGQAGWHVKDDKLVDDAGRPFRFEMLLYDPGFERVVLPMARNLKRMGIEMSVRTVDISQYQNRLQTFDFDMIVTVFPGTKSPGNEMRDYWGSQSADTKGGSNYVGVKDPMIDAMVDAIIGAPDRETLVARSKALDRVLLWRHYVIPQWYLDVEPVVYWNKFGRPENSIAAAQPVFLGYRDRYDSWWIDPDKERALIARVAETPAEPTPDAATTEAPQASAPSAQPPQRADESSDKPNPFMQWWRWAMVAAILALAIFRYRRRQGK
ncbi:MAG: ABC transporter substrate-binding protein [Gemmatimonas sp.]